MIIHQQKKLQREEAILSSLKTLDYLSRSQLQRLHGLSGDRNARRVLSNMGGLVTSFRGENGEGIYHLTKAGRERIGAIKERKKLAQVGHYLMRADAYIYHGCPEAWKNEQRVKVGDVTVVTDALFFHNGRRKFLEIDHLQHMTKNREKVERYKRLKATGVLQEKYKHFPALIWVTLTETRKRQLLELCDVLDCKVHLWSDIK